MRIPASPPIAVRASQAAGVVLSAVMSMSLAFAQAHPAQSTQPPDRFDNGEEAFRLRVVDQQGAVIVGARVSLVAMASRKLIDGTTNRQGIWSQSRLTGGPYSLSVAARSFATYTARVMIVEGRPVMRQVIMTLNVVRQETEVEGTPFLVETSAPSPPPSLYSTRITIWDPPLGGGPGSVWSPPRRTRRAWMKKFRISRLWHRRPSNQKQTSVASSHTP